MESITCFNGLYSNAFAHCTVLNIQCIVLLSVSHLEAGKNCKNLKVPCHLKRSAGLINSYFYIFIHFKVYVDENMIRFRECNTHVILINQGHLFDLCFKRDTRFL